MSYTRKFSLFVSSTYEDLKEERQIAVKIALENNFIPIGMEQFHAAPVSQWEIITKMMDECDFYLLIIGGCYGSIDKESGLSYTEKEYNYAKTHNIPICALIQNEAYITQDKMDKKDTWEKQPRLELFRDKVKNQNNTVDFFDNEADLKYKLSASLKNLGNYAKDSSGWVRYEDVQDIVNKRLEDANSTNEKKNTEQMLALEGMMSMLEQFGKKLEEVKSTQFSSNDNQFATKEDIQNLFRIEGDTLYIDTLKDDNEN